MDSRRALEKNTLLRFNDGYEYTVINELARGGSSIVYNAFYYDNLNEKKSVIIKECYPFRCNLKRGSNSELIVPAAEADLFEKARQKMLRAYQLGNEFFHTDGLTNLTANTYNIFTANNTLYVVSAYSQGQELSYQRYKTVKESIAVVKSVADTIRKIHNKGFLYLDVKPCNVLTLEGTTELIQLFDFDTLVPISDLGGMLDIDNKISYTKGFAALEQQTGEFNKIGRHSDVYGIGALLFYMLFNRVPSAFDCELDAEYDFKKSKLSGSTYQDALAFKLTDFFHNTLADYYLDRFSNMETVIEKLTELQALADLSCRYINRSKISKPTLFLGRETESGWITEKLKNGTDECFFIVGMGGIGKSTLVRNCVKQNEELFDTVLYLNYLGSIEETIIDDYSVHINSVKKDKTETNQTYFNRKLSILQELGKDKRCLLIIDNYTGDETEALPKLLQLGWITLFIARDKSLAVGFEALELKQLPDRTLLNLFVRYIGHELTEDEVKNALSIIENVGGHTLVIELIAKQISSPICSLSVQNAADIVSNSGFSDLAAEKMDHQKDSRRYHSTVRQIIADLFEADKLSVSQRTILKVLSLFGRNGISVNKLCEMLGINNKDDISALYNQGWLCVEDTIMTMHPVIEEVVANWKFSEAAMTATIKVLAYLDSKLKEEYSRKNIDYIQHIRGREPVFGDLEELELHLLLAASVLERGKRESRISSLEIYKELLYYTIKNTPCENEDFIREKSEEFIALFHHDNEIKLMDIYQGLLEVLYEHGEFKLAVQRITEARNAISGKRSPYLWGQYHYILAGYYDAVLNGFYDAATKEEAELVRFLLSSVDKAIKYMKLSRGGDSGQLLGEYYRLKALVLIRGGNGTRKQVWTILGKVQRLIDRYAQPNSRLVRDYYMTLAWYYTYVEEESEKTAAYLSKAYEITEIVSVSEFDKIDELFSPSANILLEWQQYDAASKYLLQAVVICEKHLEIVAYKRKQVELLGHLLQVYFHGGEREKCRAVIDMIDEKVREIGGINVDDYVPAEVRECVMKKA